MRELLTEYGQVDVIWFDFCFPRPTAAARAATTGSREKLLKLVRELQPDIIINDRLDLPTGGGWDFKTPEQFKPREWVEVNGKPVAWEACQTFSRLVGLSPRRDDLEEPEATLDLLIDTVSKGGNLLLNVGPTARGDFDERALERLAAWASG